MQEKQLRYLKCPVTRTDLTLQVIRTTTKKLGTCEVSIISEGVLFSQSGWFYPIINGIPRLLVEAFIDYASFLSQHLSDYQLRKQNLIQKYQGIINYALKKNTHTRESFSQEWNLYNYDADKTWNANPDEMLHRFYRETNENKESIKNKVIFDAGCGNGLLDSLLAQNEAIVIAMDLSLSIEKAFVKNCSDNVLFIQGDVQFPPVSFNAFDIVHCSGVLIHTNNTELSFSCLTPCVKLTGKLSVWLYHPRRDSIHNLFNFIRRYSSKLPLRVQYYLYYTTLFPISYLVKRAKGNTQNKREMMIDILDWFTPQFRWEHTHEEAESWFYKHQFQSVHITTTNEFGFNMIGTKNS